MELTLDGTVYSGRFTRGYDSSVKKWVYAFTALTGDGFALWGIGQ